MSAPKRKVVEPIDHDLREVDPIVVMFLLESRCFSNNPINCDDLVDLHSVLNTIHCEKVRSNEQCYSYNAWSIPLSFILKTIN
ncbi:MAG: hypothetical protein HPY73_00405 [Methanomassiliicoccales archaeon]|nr:MAG: hypothetical protein HPY73_00405 [Methanomassiliicoccales archaeon]